MNAIEQLLALADEYARATGAGETTVSWRVFGDTKKLGAIRAGSDIQTGRFERAIIWFSANWPESAAWPSQIERPVVQAAE
jgi:hypothetical protein